MRKLRHYVKVLLYYLFRIFPVRQNKIFIQNFGGKGYGESPKYIAEEIIKRDLGYKLVWALKSGTSEEFPHNNKINFVRYGSARAIYEEATAKMWIDNFRKQSYVRKRKSQYYIQLWHGFPIKKVEKDVERNLPKPYLRDAKRDSTMINLFVSESKFQNRLYRSSFWFDGEIFYCGSPKHSAIINAGQNIENDVKRHFNIAENKKIVLYTPTFRNNYSTDVYDIDYEAVLDSLRERTKNEWVFLIRLHPNISNKSGAITYNERIIQASGYDDIQNLYIASDILITDYSGCMVDFSVTGKPAFLYINDYEEYRKDRDFYFDLRSLPFPCAANTEELLEKMTHFDNKAYSESLAKFFQETGLILDGKGAEKLVDRIEEELMKRVKNSRK
jgi:CDP-glycerol glycerophosphotransferase